MISACQCSVQQNADDPGSRFEAARDFKSRRPHQTWPNLVRDEQDLWESGGDLNLKGDALVAHHITGLWVWHCEPGRIILGSTTSRTIQFLPSWIWSPLERAPRTP